jgi:hypothetical protein
MRNGAELGFCHREERRAVAISEPGDCFASLAMTAVK